MVLLSFCFTHLKKRNAYFLIWWTQISSQLSTIGQLVNNNPTMQFFTGISRNLLCYHWLSFSGNSKSMHCGILMNMPYSEFYLWLRMSGFLLFCFNIHLVSLAEFHSMTVHYETNINILTHKHLIIATFNCLCLLNLFRMASCYETFNLIKHNSLWKPHCGFRMEQHCDLHDG